MQLQTIVDKMSLYAEVKEAEYLEKMISTTKGNNKYARNMALNAARAKVELTSREPPPDNFLEGLYKLEYETYFGILQTFVYAIGGDNTYRERKKHPVAIPKARTSSWSLRGKRPGPSQTCMFRYMSEKQLNQEIENLGLKTYEEAYHLPSFQSWRRKMVQKYDKK